jgi:hypothetical protein
MEEQQPYPHAHSPTHTLTDSYTHSHSRHCPCSLHTVSLPSTQALVSKLKGSGAAAAAAAAAAPAAVASSAAAAAAVSHPQLASPGSSIITGPGGSRFTSVAGSSSSSSLGKEAMKAAVGSEASVVTSVLATLGALAQQAGTGFKPYVGEVMPLVIDAIQVCVGVCMCVRMCRTLRCILGACMTSSRVHLHRRTDSECVIGAMSAIVLHLGVCLRAPPPTLTSTIPTPMPPSVTGPPCPQQAACCSCHPGPDMSVSRECDDALLGLPPVAVAAAEVAGRQPATTGVTL